MKCTKLFVLTHPFSFISRKLEFLKSFHCYSLFCMIQFNKRYILSTWKSISSRYDDSPFVWILERQNHDSRAWLFNATQGDKEEILYVKKTCVNKMFHSLLHHHVKQHFESKAEGNLNKATTMTWCRKIQQEHELWRAEKEKFEWFHVNMCFKEYCNKYSRRYQV